MRKTRTFGALESSDRSGRPIHNEEDEDWRALESSGRSGRPIHNEEDEDWRALESSGLQVVGLYIMRKTRTWRATS